MLSIRSRSMPAVACAALAVLAACSQQPDFDLVISGASVIDGTGAAARRADVGIKGDRIAAIGNLAERSTSMAIDATGKTIAPGFINVVSRSGVALLANGSAESDIRQGITTEVLADAPALWTRVTANEDALRASGMTLDWSGLKGYFEKMQARGDAPNVAALVPLSPTVTTSAIDEAMRDGAFGIVDGPAVSAADVDAATAVAARYGGVPYVGFDSPLVTTDDALAAFGARASRIVIRDIDHTPPGTATEDLMQRIARAGPRGFAVYGAVVPSADPMQNAAVRNVLRHGGVMIATGSAATTAAAPGDAPPAAFGAFPRYLGQMVRDDHALDLAEAVRRVTSMPADLLHLRERGIVRERWFADLVVFDPRTIADRATAAQPRQYPAGVDYVLVNGVVVVTPRGPTGARPGHALVHAP